MPVPVAAIGTHLIIEFWGAELLTDLAGIEAALREAAHVTKAVVLDVKLHEFSGGGGVTGVALLAESHISIHTWPEHGYAALDVFICGGEDPLQALAVLKERFKPSSVDIQSISRGLPIQAAETVATAGLSGGGQ